MTTKRTLNGRQLAFLIWDKYRRDIAEVGITEFFDLRDIRIKNDDLKKFVHEWDDVMFGLLYEPDPNYLLSLFELQVSQCQRFRQTYSAYKLECTHKGLEHTYTILRKWVQAHIDSRQQDKLRHQLQRSPSEQPHSRAAASVNDKGAHVPKKQRKKKGKRGDSEPPAEVGRSPRSPRSRNEGQRHQGTDADVDAPRRSHGSPGRTPPPWRRDSKSGVRGSLDGNKYIPSRTREESRGRAPSNERDRPPCQAFINGKCTKGAECREWHVADCRFFKLGNCLAGSNCIFLHRDNNGNVTNVGRANTAKPKRKTKARAKGKASTCISLESQDSREIRMPLEFSGIQMV